MNFVMLSAGASSNIIEGSGTMPVVLIWLINIVLLGVFVGVTVLVIRALLKCLKSKNAPKE